MNELTKAILAATERGIEVRFRYEPFMDAVVVKLFRRDGDQITQLERAVGKTALAQSNLDLLAYEIDRAAQVLITTD